MPTLAINKRNLDTKIPRPDKGQVVFYFDPVLKGFGVRVTHGDAAPESKQSHITFIAQRRVNGKVVRHKIDSYPPMTPDKAKEIAADLLSVMRKGINPTAEKSKMHGATLAQMFEAFMKERDQLRPKTRVVYRSVFKLHLVELHDMPLCEIDTKMLRDLYKKIRDKHQNNKDDTAADRGKATASQAIRLVSAIFNHAIVNEEADVKANPVISLRLLIPGWSTTRRRQSVLLKEELRDFWKALNELQHQTTKDYLTLLFFCALRRAEAAQLTWSDYDRKHKLLRLRSETTKSDREIYIPVSKFIADMLNRRQDEPGAKRSKFIFPSDKSASGHIEECKTATNVISKRIGKHVMPHDSRRGVATAATQLGINTITLKQILNHSTEREVTSGYAIANAEALREPVETISKYFQKCMGINQSRAR